MLAAGPSGATCCAVSCLKTLWTHGQDDTGMENRFLLPEPLPALSEKKKILKIVQFMIRFWDELLIHQLRIYWIYFQPWCLSVFKAAGGSGI